MHCAGGRMMLMTVRHCGDVAWRVFALRCCDFFGLQNMARF